MGDWKNIFAFHNLIYLINGILGIVLYAFYKIQKNEERKETERLKCFSGFLDSVSYQYTISQDVEQAVLECQDAVPDNLLDLTEEFYNIMIAGEREKLREYKEVYSSNFYFHFLMYSFLAMEYGDCLEDSSYLKNISFLNKQIFIWIMDREKLNYFFSGIIFLILFPIQFLKPIEVWAGFNLAELNRYYRYSYGAVSRFSLLFLTVICYQAIMLLRENYSVHFHNSIFLGKLKQLNFLKRNYAAWIERNPKKVKKLTSLLQNSFSRLSLQELIILQKILFLGAALVCLVVFAPILNDNPIHILIWCLITVLISSVFYYVPVLYLQLRALRMEKQKEDEVYFFYGIAQMAALKDDGDVDEILEWMELGGEIFEPMLLSCIEEFSYDNDKALEDCKKATSFSPFIKLLDALAISERTGLEHALSPLHKELEHYIEKRKQDNEIATSNKGVLGRFIAFIPMVFMLGLYLIVPFVLESLVQLQEYIRQIQESI